jgi:hypothetical protein
MASNIILKKSSLAARVPATADLAYGELALNYADGALYYKRSDNTIQNIIPIGGSGTVTSVSGTGTVSGLTLSGTVTSTGSLTLGGSLTLTSGQVTGALGFTPYNATNPSGYITSSDSITGNAATATTLQTARTINGVSFNGSANITVADVTKLPLAGGTMTGAIAFAGAQTWPTFNQNTTGTAANVTGTVAVVNGGTGATTSATARTNLGATTLGSNLFTLTNVAAIAFPRLNADNTVSSLSASDFRTAIGAGTSSTTGTVTSVGGTGTVSGLSLSGTVTSSGNLTLGGTLVVAASNFASQTANTVLIAPNGSAGVPTFRSLVASDIPTLNQNTTGSAATLTTGRTIALTGDVTYTSGSFNGSANVTGTATLASVGTAGTYTKVTTDAKGRITSGTTLAATDIPNLDAAKITSGTIDAARLPSYVDDVIEGANLASFPTTGETGKIYVALDTNKTYRWSGSAYVFITSGAVDSVAGKTGVITLTSSDVGLGNVENKSSATIRGEITSGNVTTALGFTPYNATNPNGYTTNTGTVTSVGGTGTVSGLTLTGTVTASGSLTLGGTLAVTASNFASQTANTVLVAPNGSAGVPTFRTLVAADIPTLNQNTTGNAATATTLQTARTINGVSFNGSADITVADATKLPLAGGTMTGAIAFAGAQTWPTFNQNTTGNAATVTNGVYTTGNQTIAGVKTFSSPIVSTGTFNINGSAGNDQPTGLYVADLGTTVGTTLNPTATAAIMGQIVAHRSVGFTSDGTYIYGFRSHSSAITYTWSSRVKLADALTTARTINGVSFNGSANITVADATKLPLAGGTMTGAIAFAGAQTWPTFNQNTTGTAANISGTTLTSKTLDTCTLQSYREKVTVVGTVSTSTYNIDLSLGNIFDITLGANVTFTFTNPPASNFSMPATIILRQDGTGNRLATFTNAKYTEGNLPQLSTAANRIDVLTYFTINGGSFWFGTFAMANVS